VVIAGILLRGSRFFVSPRVAGVIAILGIELYAILVGADSAVVRAAIKASMAGDFPACSWTNSAERCLS